MCRSGDIPGRLLMWAVTRSFVKWNAGKSTIGVRGVAAAAVPGRNAPATTAIAAVTMSRDPLIVHTLHPRARAHSPAIVKI